MSPCSGAKQRLPSFCITVQMEPYPLGIEQATAGRKQPGNERRPQLCGVLGHGELDRFDLAVQNSASRLAAGDVPLGSALVLLLFGTYPDQVISGTSATRAPSRCAPLTSAWHIVDPNPSTKYQRGPSKPNSCSCQSSVLFTIWFPRGLF